MAPQAPTSDACGFLPGALDFNHTVSRPHPLRFGRKRMCAFSMIELLMVISVIALLMGLGAYAFSGSGSITTALSTSATQVSTSVSGARQLAVSGNCRTRFIIMTAAEGNDPTWRLQTYAVLKEELNGTKREFVLTTPLERLRAGLYFQREYRDADLNTERQMIKRVNTESDPSSPDTEPFRIQGRDAEYAYIEFLPTGGTASPSQENVFLIERGSDPGVSIPNDPNYVRLGVSQNTGRVRFERP